MALDACGLLYVATPGRSGSSCSTGRQRAPSARRSGGARRRGSDLSGRVYVADREGRRSDAAFRPRGGFRPTSPEGFPPSPRPIAVTVDGDGAVLVADARHPRLLRFTPQGLYLGDVVVTSAVSEAVEARLPAAVLRQLLAHGGVRPRLGVCGPCSPSNDARRALADLHRAVRLLALRLARSFAPQGTFISAALDGGLPGTTWHTVEVDADLPAGTGLTVETRRRAPQDGQIRPPRPGARRPPPRGRPVHGRSGPPRAIAAGPLPLGPGPVAPGFGDAEPARAHHPLPA
jgi:hypothetical protein